MNITESPYQNNGSVNSSVDLLSLIKNNENFHKSKIGKNNENMNKGKNQSENKFEKKNS